MKQNALARVIIGQINMPAARTTGGFNALHSCRRYPWIQRWVVGGYNELRLRDLPHAAGTTAARPALTS